MSWNPLSQSPTHQPVPRLVDDVNIVMSLSPIIAHKDHPRSLLTVVCFLRAEGHRRRPSGSVLNGTTPH